MMESTEWPETEELKDHHGELESGGASSYFRVSVDGVEVPVLVTPTAEVVRILFTGPAFVEVETGQTIGSAVVRPLSRGIVPRVADKVLSFALAVAGSLSVEVDGDLDLPLIVIADEPVPCPEGSPGLLVLEAGEHEAEFLEIRSHSVLYLAHGARLKGPLHLTGVCDVQILGTGIVDAVSENPGLNKTAILLDRCENITICGPLCFMKGHWGCILRCCADIRIDNLKLLGHEKCSDGIDVDGSRRVRVTGGFIKNNDDCLCIKSSPLAKGATVEDVEFSGCTLWNGCGGNGIELGYESQTENFRNITFRNIDIIHVQTEDDGGWIDRIAALSMHITGDAHVQNVLFENITIEDVWTPKMIQFTTFHYYREHGWFSPADRLAKGRISNVHLKNIRFLDVANVRVHVEGFNGPDDIENVRFEGVTVAGINLKDRVDLVLEVVNTRNLEIC